MKADDTFRVTVMYGSSRLERRHVFKDGRMSFESRRIDYDERGGIRNVGDWAGAGVSIGWDDGSPYTPADHRAILA